MANVASREMDFDEIIRCQNLAEDKFESEYNHHARENGSWTYKYGIDNDKTHDNNLMDVDSFVLNTPDFLCWDNTIREFRFVEVKFCGFNLYLKQAHFDNYKKWNKIYPVNFWIYNHKAKVAYLSIDRLDELIVNNEYDTDKHHDCNKICWIIPFNDLLL